MAIGDSLGKSGLYDSAISSVSAETTSTLILSAADLADIKYLSITNDSSGGTVYLAIGEPAVLNSGIRLNSAGGNALFTFPNIPKKAIYGIAAASRTVAILRAS